jgi:hypothetical protein
MQDDEIKREIELHLATLARGASQADYDHARARLLVLRQEIEHRERNVAFANKAKGPRYE